MRGKPLLLQHFRIDRESQQRVRELETAGITGACRRRSNMRSSSGRRIFRCLKSPEWVRPGNGALTIRFSLPRQAVSLIVLEVR